MKSTFTTVAVFGTMLASICNAQLGKPSRTDRSFIKTRDGMLLRQEEPVSIVTTTTPDGRTLQQATGTIKCRLWQNCITFEDGSDGHQWECTFDDPGLDVRYTGYNSKLIVTPGNRNYNDYFHLNGAVSGTTLFVVNGADLTDERMIVDPENVVGTEIYDPESLERGDPVGGDVEPDPRVARGLPLQRKRRLTSTTGTLKTLVVRVVASDSAPAPASDLYEDIFNDEYCLKSQYDRCSYGQLKIQEYQGDISGFPTEPNAPGVVDVVIDAAANGNSRSAIQAAANEKLQAMLGVSDPGTLFDLVMFCMPPGTGTWLAYAYINKWDSYYNNDWCQAVSSQMHEVGHNIGLHHSGEYEGSDSVQEYGDQTDLMGYSYRSDDSPAMCFNAAKNWQLGWFESQQIALDPSEDLGFDPVSFILNGVVDYQENIPGRYVVIRINNFYIGFNRATDFNSGVQEAPNQVTVVEKLGEPTSATKSKLAAKLSVGQQFTIVLSEILSVQLQYVSNDNGKDAVVELNVIGEPVECVGGYNKEVTLTLVTDNYPSDISWGIADPSGKTIFFQENYETKGTYDYTIPGLCAGLQYSFFVNDEYGDGICCSWGQGSYTLTYEGEVLLTGGEYGEGEIRPFTLPLPDVTLPPTTENPTKNPTSSPTKNPTLSPTKNPTFSPTGGPTSGPTKRPTSSPTGGPTSTPTVGPTAEPTSSPVSSPTAEPTSSPVSSPTAEPTSSPVSSPTAEPTSSPVSSPTAEPTTTSPLDLTGCVDDPNFIYRNKARKDCAWVAKGSDRNTRIKCLRRAASDKTDKTKVYKFCKETCDRAGVKKAC